MKRRFRSFRKKPVVRWFATRESYISPGSVGYTVTTAGGAISTALLAMHKRNSPATADLIEANQRHTIVAVRGDIVIAPDVDTALILSCGIKVCELDGFGSPLPMNPASVEEATEPWMWLGHKHVPKYDSPNGPCTIPGWEIHIKSKRVMKDNEALALFMSVQPALENEGDDGDVFVYPFLRTLVSRGE